MKNLGERNVCIIQEVKIFLFAYCSFYTAFKEEWRVKLKDNYEFIYGMIDYCRRLFYKLRLSALPKTT